MSRTSYQFLLALGAAALATGPVVAQDPGTPTGYITLGAAYSERYGETAFATISEENLFGTGIGAGLSAEYSRSGYRISADLDTGFTLPVAGSAIAPELDISVYLDERKWQDAAYSNRRAGIDADLRFSVNERLNLVAGYFFYDDTLSNVAATTSPLIAAEAGQQTASGAKLGLYFDSTDNPLRPESGLSLGVTARYAGLGGDSNWTSLTANAALYQPLPMNGIASLSVTGGQIRSLDGNAIRITDRAFLGYDLPRGFAFGGLGPRDFAGAVNSPLGGETYAAASIATDFPMFETRSGTVYGGIFWEGGSVWDLQNTTGGAMPLVDDSLNWRASYGISLSWVGPFGNLRLSWADAYLRQSYDITQPVSLTFSTSF